MNELDFLDKELREANLFLNKRTDEFLDKNTKKPQEDKTLKVIEQNSPMKKTNNEQILEDYQNRLKLYNFPELGQITLSTIPSEQEKTLKFFEYIIKKKANESQDFQKYRSQSESLSKKCELLEFQISKDEREIKSLNDELKTYTKSKKVYELKLNKQKETYEKQITSLKNSQNFLTNKINKLNLDKKALEEKYAKISDAYSKISNTKSKVVNSIEMTEYVNQNDIGKMLSKVKGAEKLVMMLKNGYNESFRELLLEINCLKNFIIDIHNDIKSMVECPVDLNEEIINLPFLDIANNIKLTFNKNLYLLRMKLGLVNEIEQDPHIQSQIVPKEDNAISDMGDNDYGEDEIRNFSQNEVQKTSGKNVREMINNFAKNHNINLNENKNDKKNMTILEKKESDNNILTANIENEEEDFEKLKMKWTKSLMSLANKEDNNYE